MNNLSLPKGVITASVTPMNVDLSPDIDLLTEHCNSIFDNGGHGILLMGTTGEANSFSVPERMSVLNGLIGKGLDPKRMLIGTGTCSLAETEQLTRHAIDSGAAGVLVMPPFYYRKVNEDGLFRYFATLFERIGEPFHLYLYHFPAMSGIDISMRLLGRLITTFPERFVGIKDSSGDLEHMLEILKRFPDFRLYSGTERLLVDTLQNGSQGCISATTNYSIAHAATVYEKFINGKDYSTESLRMLAARKAFEGNILAAAVKGILHMRSGKANWQNIRPPLTMPEDESLKAIFGELQSNV